MTDTNADNSAGAGTGRRRRRDSRVARWICVTMLLAVLTGGLGFAYKLVQFSKEALGEETASFAAVPVLVYACVAVGFASLFLWALLRGQFKDVEAPKYRMLEREADYERRGI